LPPSRQLGASGRTAPLRLYVLAVVLVHTLGHFAYMGLWRHLAAPDFDVNDFKAYYTAGLAVRLGEASQHLYSDPGLLNLGLLPPQPWVDFAVSHGVPHPSAYIYPPFFAVAMAPLTLLPYHAANLAWFCFNTALLAVSVMLLVRIARAMTDAPEDAPLGVLAVAVVFVCLNFFPTVRAMQCGQVGPLLLFLLSAALALCLAPEGGSARRDALAGACLALAAAIKLTPIVLIAWLAWAGRRRVAAWSLAWLAGFTALAVVVAGWGNHLLYIRGFLPSLARGAATYANQSVNGFLNRMLTDRSVAAFDFSEEPALVWWGTRLAAVALLGASFWMTRPRGDARQRPARQLAPGYGLIVLSMLLTAPISWEHHYVLALLPLAIMIGRLADGSDLRGLALASVAYTAMAIDIFELCRKDLPFGSRYALSYVLCGGALLWLATARSLRARRLA
jgi:alpha-1,2-mannosyltransferase